MNVGSSMGLAVAGAFTALALTHCQTAEQDNDRRAGLPGRAIYERNCAVCHGLEGDGKGEAAFLLRPKPRSFRSGKFRLVSSDGLSPTREDLFRTISNGMPGTPMPPWTNLTEEERFNVVDYVLELSREGWTDVGIEMGFSEEKADEYATRMIDPGQPIEVPPEPPVTPEGENEARRLYQLACAKCHGDDGEGKRDPQWRTSEGFPTWARNFREGVFKGGREGEQLYLRLLAGLPGTPMPSQTFTPEQTWHLVHFVQSFSDPGAQERATIHAVELVARQVESLPLSPEDEAWEDVSPERVPLMPLWWREGYIPSVRVRTLHDDDRLAILLEWDDESVNAGGVRQDAFPDGAAVQLTASSTPPLFAMGQSDEPVNIWHWKALWDEDRKGFRDVDTAFPHIAVDGYYGTGDGWEAAPLEDGTYRPAATLGNLVASADRTSAVEDANAAGLGTLTSQTASRQNVEGRARRTEHGWRLELVRDIDTGDTSDVALGPGRSLSLAFAVWDGSAGDRDGQKSVSIWNTLTWK